MDREILKLPSPLAPDNELLGAVTPLDEANDAICRAVKLRLDEHSNSSVNLLSTAIRYAVRAFGDTTLHLFSAYNEELSNTDRANYAATLLLSAAAERRRQLLLIAPHTLFETDVDIDGSERHTALSAELKDDLFSSGSFDKEEMCLKLQERYAATLDGDMTALNQAITEESPKQTVRRLSNNISEHAQIVANHGKNIGLCLARGALSRLFS